MGEGARCPWAKTEHEILYHDTEWCRPCRDDRALFELLELEGFQAGLSWKLILERRAALRAAFADFEPAALAGGGEDEGEAALAALAPFYVDSAFVSCRSVSLDRGITDSNEQSAAFRSDAIRRAGLVYLVADHTKFGQTSFVQICGFDALAGIVTDQPLSAPWHWMAQERKLLLLENAPEA